jgi:hypothetical protein
LHFPRVSSPHPSAAKRKKNGKEVFGLRRLARFWYSVRMRFQARNLPKIFLCLALLVVLLISATGLPHFGMTMSMDEHGNMAMSDCYMPGMTTLCKMNVFDHMAWWQSMFTSIPAQNILFSLLLLVAAAIVLFTWSRLAHSPPEKLPMRFRFRQRNYIPLASPLQELFSSGILNPKLF